MWYRRAAEQGDSLAQYSLGLLYDRGFGVPRDIVEANKWLNLSTAAVPPRAGGAGADLRGAATIKMTRGRSPGASAGFGWAPVKAPQSRIDSASQQSHIAGARNRPKGRKAVVFNGRRRIVGLTK